MAKIKPFKAVRPKEQLAEKVSTLPYDVYSEEEARDIVQRNPYSFLKIVRPETLFPDDVNIYDSMVYEAAKGALQEFIDNGTMIADGQDCYYVYREIMNGRSQTGLVACFSVDDYENGVVKRHEYTRHEKEDDRTKHIDVCGANTGLVSLAFENEAYLKILLEQATHKEPVYDFWSEDQVRQLVWRVDEPEKIKKITECVSNLDRLYIADGHHRCASAAAVCKMRRERLGTYTGEEEFNYFLAVAFPKDQLLIYPYNRVAADLNGLSVKEFLKALTDAGFEVEKVSRRFTARERRHGVYQPRRKGEIAMYLDGHWYRLTAGEKLLSEDPVKSLDVSLLQDNVLDKILGIKDPRTDKRVDFVGGIRGLKELEKRCHADSCVGFGMYPTSMDELINVVEDNKVMPPKSTWFEPKLQSGLFVHRF